jgi:hypothetical protein
MKVLVRDEMKELTGMHSVVNRQTLQSRWIEHPYTPPTKYGRIFLRVEELRYGTRKPYTYGYGGKP